MRHFSKIAIAAIAFVASYQVANAQRVMNARPSSKIQTIDKKSNGKTEVVAENHQKSIHNYKMFHAKAHKIKPSNSTQQQIANSKSGNYKMQFNSTRHQLAENKETAQRDTLASN